MTASLLRDAFGHHVWATLRLIDTCADLDPDQLATSVPGTYGSIIDTFTHLVGADCSYLTVIGGVELPTFDDSRKSLEQMREVMRRNGELWGQVLERDPDPDHVAVRHRDDGSESHAPIGVRLAQVLHHGTDHRSQICTALTSIGVEPPDIDVWDFAWSDGRHFEIPPPS